MRVFLFFLFAAITAALLFILNGTTVLPAPLGKLLSPQQGFWQNAQREKDGFNEELHFTNLKGKVDVYFDDRMVPHVFAENNEDVFFVQGYLHAKDRLWQMEFQTMAASGDLSSLIGDKALPHDREFRRLGMTWAAEKAVEEMEADPMTKAAGDNYTAGVNAYIKTLSTAELPLEYKLIGYEPKPWSNLKTALFLKYMSYSLSSGADDFELTNAKNYFTKDLFDLLYPATQDSLDPIIPRSQPFIPQTVFPVAPASADSLYFNKNDDANVVQLQAHPDNGSNNWAVAGSKTASGYPILCNDPHLVLNLPSLWYEMQLHTPTFNAYGASFPGSPGVVIGFNDSIAFGFTNGGRDVRDYYEISFKDETRNEYLFNGTYHTTEWRVEKIPVKGQPDFIDSVAYVTLGKDKMPVMYDPQFNGMYETGTKNYAVRWTAHDAGNELKLFLLLDEAKGYADYQNAAQYLGAPGQNIVYADVAGNIALRTQGRWPAKWKGQGDFVMPGTDSSYLWQGFIPNSEVPYQFNPERAFVSSANQKPVAETYPYYLGRRYPEYRGRTINKKLATMQNITIEDMMKMQTDTYDGFAAMALPIVLKNLPTNNLSAAERAYYDTLQQWNYHDDIQLTAPTLFNVLWRNLADTIFHDEYKKGPYIIKPAFETTLNEAMLRDSNYVFFDNINTPQKETLQDNVLAAFKKMVADADKLKAKKGILWQQYNNLSVTHLARQPALSRTALPASGGRNAINANNGPHGPSWRMIVQMGPEIEAYGIYPGGQSGNPSSKYYDSFVDDWAAGKYYKLWVMKASESTDERVKGKMHFSK